tara:strand:- start:3783 stop:3932 length:150 start_codon:yes stop_codon:yes gene_type:complete
MAHSPSFYIKLFFWNNIVERFYQDWLEEYANDMLCEHQADHEDMRYDLD